MEPLKDYLTKEGWSRDLEKTIERHSKTYEFLKSGDWQALIPGWNIYYMAKEGIKIMKQSRDQMKAFAESQEQGKHDIALVQSYAEQRDNAKARGDLKTASEFEDRILRLVDTYLKGM